MPSSWGAKALTRQTLKCNKEGHCNQPQSHMGALLTNSTRALCRCREYHNNTHPTKTIISAVTSIAATRVQQPQTASFYQPAQEPWVVRLMQQWQLLPPSAWPTQAAQNLRQRRSQQTSTTTRRVSPSARTRASSPDAYTASITISCTTSATLICTTKHANYTIKHKQQQKTHSRRDMCTTHHARNNCWTISKLSCLAEQVTLSPVPKKQAQATTTKKCHFW